MVTITAGVSEYLEEGGAENGVHGSNNEEDQKGVAHRDHRKGHRRDQSSFNEKQKVK